MLAKIVGKLLLYIIKIIYFYNAFVEVKWLSGNWCGFYADTTDSITVGKVIYDSNYKLLYFNVHNCLEG